MKEGGELRVVQAALADGKGERVVTLPTLRQSGGLFSHVVVATAGSGRHAAALADRVRRAWKSAGLGASRVESSEEREWVLIDCGDVVVHIMQESARTRYRLEELWGFEGRGG